MDNISPRRMVENEVIFRKVNQNVQQFLEDVNAGDKIIKFFCECSDEDCKKRIEMTPKEYKALHSNRREFIVIDGHETPEVEKIVKEYGNFNVVEKFIDPPSPQEISTALKKINHKAANSY